MWFCDAMGWASGSESEGRWFETPLKWFVFLVLLSIWQKKHFLASSLLEIAHNKTLRGWKILGGLEIVLLYERQGGPCIKLPPNLIEGTMKELKE